MLSVLERPGIIIGLFLCIATPIPLIIQLFKLKKSQNTEGISFVSFGASCLGCLFSFMNIVILNWIFMINCDLKSGCYERLLMCVHVFF